MIFFFVKMILYYSYSCSFTILGLILIPKSGSDLQLPRTSDTRSSLAYNPPLETPTSGTPYVCAAASDRLSLHRCTFSVRSSQSWLVALFFYVRQSGSARPPEVCFCVESRLKMFMILRYERFEMLFVYVLHVYSTNTTRRRC